jgi:cell division protein FtsB
MAEESRAQRRERERAERERRQRARRGLALLLGVLWLFFGLWAVVGPGGLREVQRLHTEVDVLKEELRASERANKQRKRQIDAIESDPAAIERLAREMLDYQSPGEITYLLPDQD